MNLGGGPSLRLQPGLRKAGVTGALLGDCVHLAATLGCGNRCLTVAAEVCFAKPRIYLITVLDCFGGSRGALLIFKNMLL